MKLKSRAQPGAPGLMGTARTDRRTANLVGRLAPGDIAVIDQVDLDSRTAHALADTGVTAVLNQSDLISGRFPTKGPQILVDAGILLVDRLVTGDRRDALSVIGDGRRVRVHRGEVYVDGSVVATGRTLDAGDVAEQQVAARDGLAAQVNTLTHNSAEFLRREQAMLLHGEGFPRLRSELTGRPVVVIADGPDDRAELRLLRRYLREVGPAIIAVGGGVDTARAVGLRPDVVLLDSHTDDLPPAKALRSARDVVVTVAPGRSQAERTVAERFDRLGLRSLAMATSAAPADAALLLADAAGARVIITVGVRASIEEFLDRDRTGLGSGYMTRLRTGPKLIDATAVPALYSGQLRAVHAWLVLLVGLLAVAVAVATTPVGHTWALELRDLAQHTFASLQGRFS